MPQWVAFIALTALVLILLLALARASQGAVREDPPPLPAGSDGEEADGDRTDSDRNGDQIPPTRHRGIESHTAAERGTGDVPDVDTVGTHPRRGTDRWHPSTETEAPSASPETPELTTGVLLANVALTQGLFGGAVLLGVWLFEIPGAALGVTPDPWSTGVPAVALGVAFGLLLWGANEASASVADAVGAGYDEQLRGKLAPETARGWVVLIGGVLPIIAIVEEFLFRAALIGAPAAGFGVSPWALAVVSSAVFALGHGAQGRVGVVVTGGLGFVLAAGFVLSGSLLVVVLAHYLVNALEFLVHEYLDVDRVLA